MQTQLNSKMATHDVRIPLCCYLYVTIRGRKKCMLTEIIRKLKKPASIINRLSRLAQHQAQISVQQQLMFLRQTGPLKLLR